MSGMKGVMVVRRKEGGVLYESVSGRVVDLADAHSWLHS